MSATTIADTIKTGHFSRRKKNSEVIVLAKSAAAVTAPSNDTNENILATITIPANAMGPNGFIDVDAAFSHTSSGNNKQLRVRFSGISGATYVSLPATTHASSRIIVRIQNRGSASSQIGGPTTGQLGPSSTSALTSSVDTTQEQTLVITGQKATGTETLAIERYSVILHHAV